MFDSTPNNVESVSHALGRMSLGGPPRALHFTPNARMEAQHVDFKINGSVEVPEHITLCDNPRQAPIQEPVERPAVGKAQLSHQEEIGAQHHDKIRDTTQTSPVAQSEHTMNYSSESEYVPSQGLESSLEERGNSSASDKNETNEEEEHEEQEEQEEQEEHIDLDYQIPAETLRAAMLAPANTRASFWSAKMYRGPKGQSLSTHYCKTKEVAERVAQYFLGEKVLGFDIEWKPISFLTPTNIKLNASLIQLACEDRIALFHISLFTGTTAEELMPPTLKTILESPEIYKVGVAVKGDFTRLQKYLDVQPQGVFELSRLHNLVEGSGKDKKLAASNKFHSLANQVAQHLQLPLYKGQQLSDDPIDTANVRESDWSKPLEPQQIHYAAADAYAGFRLYHILEWKRKQLRPTPPSRGICDYDAKRVERPKAPKENKTTRKSKEASSAAKQGTSAVEAGQASELEQDQDEMEEEEENDEEDYETAPEETIDGHGLEDTTSSSMDQAKHVIASASSTADEYIRSQRRVGRVNMSWLRGADPGYPALPQEPDDLAVSTERPITNDLTHSVTDTKDANQSFDTCELEARENEDDEFADPELDEALQDLDLDPEGKLIEARIEPSLVSDKHQQGVDVTGPDLSNIALTERHTSRDTQPGSLEPDHVQAADELATRNTNNLDMDQSTLDDPPNSEVTTVSDDSKHTKEYTLATTWAQEYLRSTIPSPTSTAPSRIRATTPHLRAYHLWHHHKLSVEDIAGHLRDPPLAHSTVSGYILQAVNLEGLEYDNDTMRGILKALPTGLRQGRWKGMVEKVG